MASTTHPTRNFIKLQQVKAHTTLSTTEIYRRIAAGTFPAQISLGPKSSVWIESEVIAWCEARITESRGGGRLMSMENTDQQVRLVLIRTERWTAA